jgi:hypothetical protein
LLSLAKKSRASERPWLLISSYLAKQSQKHTGEGLLVHSVAVHRCAAVSQKRLEVPHRSISLVRASGVRAQLGEMQLSQPGAYHGALRDVAVRQVSEFVCEEAHECLAISSFLYAQDDFFKGNVGLGVAARQILGILSSCNALERKRGGGPEFKD